MIDFGKILKRSFQITIKNRYLWFLGLLAGGSTFGFSYGNGFSGVNEDNFQKFKDFNGKVSILDSTHANVRGVGQVLGESVGKLSSDEVLVLGIIVAIILLLLVGAIYLSITAKGAIVKAYLSHYDNKEMTLRESWSFGHKFFWRRLSFGILVCLLIILPLLVLLIPIIILAIYEHIWIAVGLAFYFAFVFFIYVFYLSLIIPYAERKLFLESLPVTESLKRGYKFFNKNWKNLALTYLILVGVQLAFAFAFGIAFLIVAGILFLIGWLFYTLSAVVAIIYGIIFGLILLIAIFCLSGAINAFSSGILTFAYSEVKSLDSK